MEASVQPKFEYRNPKPETNPNIECSKDRNHDTENTIFLPFWLVGIVSYFEIRISDFLNEKRDFVLALFNLTHSYDIAKL